jgi:hypothetical protein
MVGARQADERDVATSVSQQLDRQQVGGRDGA